MPVINSLRSLVLRINRSTLRYVSLHNNLTLIILLCYRSPFSKGQFIKGSEEKQRADDYDYLVNFPVT